jgi:hypothetical protein
MSEGTRDRIVSYGGTEPESVVYVPTLAPRDPGGESEMAAPSGMGSEPCHPRAIFWFCFCRKTGS